MSKTQHLICLLLGSNIEPEVNLPLSVSLLQSHVTVLQTSSVWESHAVGSDGPNFLNAAVVALTPLDADSLKEDVLGPLELEMGRIRTEDKNSPRTIDIDLILFDQQLLDWELWEYGHLAVPIAEVLPDYQSKSGEYLKDVASNLSYSTPIWKRTDVSFSLFQPYL